MNYKFIIIVLLCTTFTEEELIFNDDSIAHSQNWHFLL